MGGLSFKASHAPSRLQTWLCRAGDWTNKLYELCSQRKWLARETGRYADNEAEDAKWLKANKHMALVVDINGPYGAPAQDHRNFNVLLLVVRPLSPCDQRPSPGSVTIRAGLL